MKSFKKVCVHDKVIVALNTDKENYLNYDTSINGDLIGNVCVCCHDSKELNSFGVNKNFHRQNRGYTRVKFSEKVVL